MERRKLPEKQLTFHNFNLALDAVSAENHYEIRYEKDNGFNKEFHSRAEINLYCTHCLHKSISNLSRKIMNKYAAHFGNGVCTLPLCTRYQQLCAVHFY